MTIRHTVRVGQLWESNDPRRPNLVEVKRILGYASGHEILTSRVGDSVPNANRRDRVQVENLSTGKRTTIRRDQFMTGIRGWTLFKEVANAA
jgi:hypothetical protein